MFGSLRSLPFTFSDGNSQITIRDACPTHGILNDAVGILKLKYLENPDTVRSTESFRVDLLDKDGNLLAASAQGIMLSGFETGSFQSITISGTNTTANELNDLLVTV